MAPNRRQILVLDESFADVGSMIRQKMPAISAKPVTECASYWDWPSAEVPAALLEEEPQQAEASLFSADHIQANLIRASATLPTEESRLNPENDDYWAEQSDAKPLHLQQENNMDSDDYWAEASHENTVSDVYWAESVPAATSIKSNNIVEASNYWDEANHARTASDMYWNDNGSVASSSSVDYWNDSRAQLSANDRYWAMTVL